MIDYIWKTHGCEPAVIFDSMQMEVTFESAASSDTIYFQNLIKLYLIKQLNLLIYNSDFCCKNLSCENLPVKNSDFSAKIRVMNTYLQLEFLLQKSEL